VEHLLRVTQVAEILNLRPSTIYELCRRGSLPYVRITSGRRRSLIRFRADEIKRLIEERSVAPSGTRGR